MSNRHKILIECDELYAVNKNNLILLDATVILKKPKYDGDYQVESGFDEWKAKHIEHSTHADLTSALANTNSSYSFAVPDKQVLQDFLNKIGAKKTSKIVVYDSKDGIWASRLWWLLYSFGVNSQILNGGLIAWEATGYPVATGLSLPVDTENGDLELCYFPEAWLSKEQISQLSKAKASSLICALGTDQFNGTAVTRYTRRGVIPNSQNIPARLFIGADNKFLSDQKILDLLQKTSPSRELKALYCGGGISACVLAVAFALVTDNQVAIYDGSLQEWSKNLNLPLVNGQNNETDAI